MKVEILPDIFENPANEENLNRLWYVIDGGKHFLNLTNLDSYETLTQSSWYSSLSKTKRELIDVFFVSSSQQVSNSTIVIISDYVTEAFTLKEAIKYLEQPFQLILENSLNDAPFIDALIKHFPENAVKLKQHKEERWFQYDMGGGSSVRQNIETKIQSFQGEIFRKVAHKYLRCFVIIDSDRKYPEESLDTKTMNIIQFLEERNIPYHILEKREMENYLPEEAYSEITNKSAMINAFLRLSPLQMDFFDIEDGFKSKSFNDLDTNIQTLLNPVSLSVKRIFEGYSLKSINEGKNNFKSDFPRLFLSSKVTKENLLARCAHHSNDPNIHPYNPNELPDLLTEISNLL